MNKVKISTLWSGDISQSVIINLIKNFSKKKIEFVHPKDCDILFFGPYDLASTKRKVINKFKEKIGKLANFFPNLDFYSFNRKIKPLRILYSQENVNFSDIYYDYSITSRYNVCEQTHLRFPLWKELVDWSHLNIKRDPGPFIARFDNFFNIQELYLKARYEATTPGKGVTNPDFKKISNAYGINYSEINNNSKIDKVLDKILNSRKPEFVNVIIDPNQKIIPKLQFGKPIEDLSPLLSRSEFRKNMIVPPLREESKNFSEAN